MTSCEVRRKPAASQTKTGVVDYHLRQGNISPNAHPAIKSVASERTDVAVSQGWQAKDAIDNTEHAKRQAELQVHKDSFAKALSDFQSDTSVKSKCKPDVLLTSAHTWDEVLSAISNLQTERRERSDLWGRILQNFRRMSDSSPIFDAWCILLPSDDKYFSILCGGLKLIFGAAARLKQCRESIMDAMEELPTLLLCTSEISDVFDFSPALRSCSQDLMGRTFAVLSAIVQELRKSALKKGAKAFFLQGSYADDLDQSLKALRKCSQRFNQLAKACAYSEIRETKLLVSDLELQVTTEHDRTRAAVGQSGAALSSQIAGAEANVERYFERLFPRFEQSMKDFLLSHMSSRAEPLIELPPRSALASSADGKPIFDSQARLLVLNYIAYDRDALDEELAQQMSRIVSGPRALQDRVHALVSEPRLQAWMSKPSSAALFVNGRHPQSEASAPSTFVCAKIAESIRSSAANSSEEHIMPICLHHFCLVRRPPDEAGPVGMLRSMVAQLFASWEGFDFAQIAKSLRQANVEDIGDLWILFENCLTQLPGSAVVFCILDGVTAYEAAAWKADAMFIVEKMTQLAAGELPTSCVFKLLATSPGSSRLLGRCFERDETINMPDIVRAHGGSLTSRALQM